MKNPFIILLLSTLLLACGNDNASMDDSDNEMVSQEELDMLDKPCLDESHSIILPAVLQQPEFYTQNEHTALIWASTQLNNTMRNSLSDVITPPNDATYVEEDGITVFASDYGFEWTVDDEKYVYLVRDDGYQIYFYEQGAVKGREMVTMQQSDDCSSFEYLLRAVKEDALTSIGDIVFKYYYDLAGTAKKVVFGSNLDQDDQEEYTLRSFEDLSGSLTIRIKGDIAKKLSWNTDGSGTYQIFENSEIIDEGVWSF